MRDNEKIPGSDIILGIYEDQSDPLLIPPPPDNRWLPKTDWSRDHIIANED